MIEPMTSPPLRHTMPVLGTPIDVADWDTVLARIDAWGQARESRYVCICNVHSVVTASQQPELARVLAQADMATPDGAPVAWMLRRLGASNQQRINGPDLMLRYCSVAERSGTAIYLYGNTVSTLARLGTELRRHFPALRIAGSASPPFRPLSEAESDAQVRAINDSGAGVVFVSLGCPKQELWMAAQRGRVQAVTVGVGAAFDFHAGTLRRAPVWMRSNGLEWLYRLCSEPRRLWRRYLVTNTLFILRATVQLLHWG